MGDSFSVLVRVGTPKRWKITARPSDKRHLHERTPAMREIWLEEAEFDANLPISTKFGVTQAQTAGGPPILMGASSRFTYDRIAEYADGWMPIYQDHARRQASGGVDYVAGIEHQGGLARAVATGNRVLASSALGQIVERCLNLLSWASIECFLHCLQIADVFCHWWKNMPPSPTNFPLGNNECRVERCIAPLFTPLPGMPAGKPAGCSASIVS